MIPDIGMMIAAYIVIQLLVVTCRATENPFVRSLAAFAIVLVIVLSIDLYQQSSTAADRLQGLQRQFGR